MPSRHLLIFGIYYAPEPTGVAVNTTGIAEGLRACGRDVTVVTGIPHFPWWQARPAPVGESGDGMTVIRRRHYVPSRSSVVRRAAYELSWLGSCLPVLVPRRRFHAAVGVVPSLGGAFLAAAAARRYRIPHLLMFQDLVGKCAHQTGFPAAEWVGDLVSAELGRAA